MLEIKGETVILWVPQTSEEDPFGHTVEGDLTPVTVENVLITPGESADVIDTTNLSGKHIAYTLHIPKGDTHDWTGRKVTVRGEDYRTVGKARYYTSENVPLSWNGEIMVEQYEQG